MRPCACDKLELVRDQSRQRNAESVPDITLSLSFEFSGSECAWALCDLSHRQGCFSALHSERLCQQDTHRNMWSSLVLVFPNMFFLCCGN